MPSFRFQGSKPESKSPRKLGSSRWRHPIDNEPGPSLVGTSAGAGTPRVSLVRGKTDPELAYGVKFHVCSHSSLYYSAPQSRWLNDGILIF
jgi:hypothetical protein